MTVQLVGEIVETAFERSISQYPAINDEVHLVTEEDLAKIYGTAERGQVVIGRLAGAESIPVRIDLDRLVTRHSAVLGSTGAGKSTTIASLLRAIAYSAGGKPAFPNTRILLLDIHGEYATALKNIAQVFRVSPSEGEEPLLIPYWAIDTTELLSFLMGRLEDRAFTSITDRIVTAKLALASISIHNPDQYMASLRTIIAQGRKRIGLVVGAGDAISRPYQLTVLCVNSYIFGLS